MRLKSKDLIFGIEAKKLRDVFRKSPWGNMNIEFFREELKLSKKTSKQILDQMLEQGYLGKKKNEDGYLELLTKANAIRNAKFIKPITREIAERYVHELIEKSKQSIIFKGFCLILCSVGLSSELTELLSSCISGISKIIELNGSKL